MKTLIKSIALAAVIGVGLAANAHATCNIELSAGLGVSDTQISSGSSIDIAQTGALAGIGFGCDLIKPSGNGPLIGVMARYSLMKLVGDVGTADIEASNLWEVAARLGYRWHDKYAPYVLAGYSGMGLDLSSVGLSDKSPHGLMLGAGLDAHLSGSWWMRAEYSWHHFAKEDLGGGTLEPDLHVVRAAIVYQFGAADTKPLK